LEGESGNLSEVTYGFSPGTPAININKDTYYSCYGYDDIALFVMCVAAIQKMSKLRDLSFPKCPLSHFLFQPTPIFHMTKEVSL